MVYEVPCKDCSKTYIGETKRTLKVRLSEHKQAVKRGDPKNGIAVHAHESHHSIDWDGATVKRTVTNYWQRRATDAIQIRTSGETMHELGQQFAAIHSMEPYPTPLTTSLSPNSHACVDLTESHSIHPSPPILSLLIYYSIIYSKSVTSSRHSRQFITVTLLHKSQSLSLHFSFVTDEDLRG